jgi:DNA-binding transcriptional LysR family regulator
MGGALNARAGIDRTKLHLNATLRCPCQRGRGQPVHGPHRQRSSITVRKLASTRRVLVATLLQYSLTNRPDELHFRRDGLERVLKIEPLMLANDGQVLRAGALAGLGILAQPKYIVHDDLVAGRFLPVLDDYGLPDFTINLAYPS